MTVFESVRLCYLPETPPRTILYVLLFVCCFYQRGVSQSVSRTDETTPAFMPTSQPLSGEPDPAYTNLDPASLLPQDTSKGMKALNKLSSFMEWYMIYFPMPFGSYSAETNWLFGLTKYNAFLLPNRDKNDTITQ